MSVVATLTKQGTPTAQAMTQIRAALVSIQENLGGDWRDKYTLLEAFEELQKVADRTGRNLSEVTGRIEGAMAVLATTGENAENASRDFDIISNAAGASAKAFTDMAKAHENNLKILKNNITSMLKPLGDGIMELADDVAKGINKIFDGAYKPIEEITGKASAEIFKINNLFAKAASKDIDIRRIAIENINKQYGDYLDNLLSEKTSLEDIKRAQEAATNALVANTVVKQSQEEIDKIMSGFASYRSDKMEKLVAKYGRQFGMDNLALFSEGYQKALEESIKSNDWKGVGTSQSYDKFYYEFLRPMDPYYLDYSRWADDFEDIAEAYSNANSQVDQIMAMANPYQRIMDKLKEDRKVVESDGGEGESDSVIDIDAIKKELSQAKEAYAEISELRKAGTLKFVESEYKAYTDIGRNWEEYLNGMVNKYSDNKEALKLILLEFAQFSEGIIKDLFSKTDAQVKAEIAALMEDLKKDIDTQIEIDIKADNEGVKKVEKVTKLFGEILNESEFENFVQGAYGAADAIGSVAKFLGTVDSELGEIVQSMSNIVGNAASMIANAGTDPFAAFTAGVNIVSDVIGGLNQVIIQQTDANKKHAASLEAINIQLRESARALERADREGNKSSAYQDQVAALEKRKKELEALLGDLIGELAMSQGNLFGRSVKKIEQDIENTIKAIEDLDYTIEDTAQEWHDFIAGGITEVDIAGKIAQAFEDGKTSVKDFADFSKEIMKDAILEAFKAKILGQAITNAQEFLSFGLSDGDWSEGDAQYFSMLFSQGAEEARQVWEQFTKAMPDVFGIDEITQEANSMKGAIRGITEETAGVLAGQVGSIRINVLEQLNVAKDSLNELQEIARNTRYLRSIDSKMGTDNTIVARRSRGN
jgi:hypothetical protein